MKRILSVLLCLCLTALLCAGCGSAPADSGRLKIVATIFPEYEWVKNIVGDAKDVEVSLLLDKGVDLHSFQPTTQDIVRIADCDVFVYIGGESDRWADDVLKDAKNRDMLALNLMEELGAAAKEEEAVEGMEPEKEAQEEEADEIEYDEHIWLSLKNAALLTQRIADRLGEKDEANKAVYQKNAASYIAGLNELDGRYAQTSLPTAFRSAISPTTTGCTITRRSRAAPPRARRAFRRWCFSRTSSIPSGFII